MTVCAPLLCGSGSDSAFNQVAGGEGSGPAGVVNGEGAIDHSERMKAGDLSW